jgi:hypothetical protein
MLLSPESAAHADRADPADHPELERLISNAVCDERFAAALLADPAAALSNGGYAARLSGAERHLVGSVRGAQSVAEFAAQLHKRLHPAAMRTTSTWNEGV